MTSAEYSPTTTRLCLPAPSQRTTGRNRWRNAIGDIWARPFHSQVGKQRVVFKGLVWKSSQVVAVEIPASDPVGDSQRREVPGGWFTQQHSTATYQKTLAQYTWPVTRTLATEYLYMKVKAPPLIERKMQYFSLEMWIFSPGSSSFSLRGVYFFRL